MRKLLNTLYITNPVAYLSRDGENVVVKVDNQEQLRLPIHNLESIVCFGFLGVSPSLMSLCAERSVALSFLTESGYFLGKVIGPVSGNVLLRRKQYRMADDPEMSLNLARLFIAGKIANCRNILQRTVRDHSEHIDPNRISEVISILSIKQKQAIKAHEMNYLRGIEGEAAQAYFGVFDQMIVAQKEHFYMKGRNRRPPLDNVNSLLSFAYVLLMNEVRAALERGEQMEPLRGRAPWRAPFPIAEREACLHRAERGSSNERSAGTARKWACRLRQRLRTGFDGREAMTR